MTERRGVLVLGCPLLEELFSKRCKVELAFVTDEDAQRASVHVIVSDHPDLPEHAPGTPFPEVECHIETNPTTGGRKLRFIPRRYEL